MKKLFFFCLFSLAICTPLAFADRGTIPAPTGFVLQIIVPTPAPEWITLAPTVVLAGVVFSPQVPVDRIAYASSSGASGPCTLVSNFCWRSQPIALLPGSNLLTVTAVQAGQNPQTASDALMAIRITREPPIWTNQPPVWTNHPPVWTNLPPVFSNRPPVILSVPPLFWGTNNLYRYHLIACDPDNDPLTLELTSRGPVLTSVTPLTNAQWLIHAMLTNYVPAVRFRAVVRDQGPRPAVQIWPVFVPRSFKPLLPATSRAQR
ncbi:MAG: hypothetical protein N2595_09655 [bacterium]|nr:hypothetical protein [bacterium]